MSSFSCRLLQMCFDCIELIAVDNGVTCGDCVALVLAEKYGGRCDRYCESFGQVCVRAAEERDENCEVKYEASCNEAITGNQILVDGAPLHLKGVAWNPVPKGGVHPADLDFARFVDEDSKLMQEMGINAVRTYESIVDKNVLDTLWKRGIWVVNSVYNWGGADADSAAEPVKATKDHPAILMWTIGNEWNYNGLYVGSSFFDSVGKIRDVARVVKYDNGLHPIASIYGDVGKLDQAVDSLPEIDLWGEYGADAFNADKNGEDQESQAKATRFIGWLDCATTLCSLAEAAIACSVSESRCKRAELNAVLKELKKSDVSVSMATVTFLVTVVMRTGKYTRMALALNGLVCKASFSQPAQLQHAVDARMKNASMQIKQWGRLNSKYRLPFRWNLNKHNLSLKTNKFVHYVGKAWHLFVLLGFLNDFLDSTAVEVDGDIKMAVWSALRFTRLLQNERDESGVFLKEDVAKEVEVVAYRYMQLHLVLNRKYERMTVYRLFNVRPKMHLLCHIVDSCRQTLKNPASASCWLEENWVGQIARLARKTHVRTSHYSTLMRYAAGLLAMFSCCLEQSHVCSRTEVCHQARMGQVQGSL
ncbi:Beta-glucuronidase [Durusdinium trenchii]|uniref:Beta-glucuronidase n=1 Tax=Durusdinium trenchii TaxID=1381693 RepID=A0ABP0M5D2_9DINO